MNPQIRQATEQDAPIISALNADVHQLHVVAAPHFFKPVSDETFPAAKVLEIMAKPQNRFYISSEDGLDVGYLYLEVLNLPADNMRHARRWVYIHQIAVKPAYQQHGHGLRLMEQAKQVARELDIHTVALDSWEFNQKARRFFARQGFATFSHRMWMTVEPMAHQEMIA
jgi:N-acetylglutamate synthase-like GNAT family acetyltransferase